jgi:hypothetical protein
MDCWVGVLVRYLLLTLCFLLWVETSTADVLLINNGLNQQKILHRYEIQSIFMLHRLYWNDGTNITPVFLPSDNPLHIKFVNDVLKVSPYNFNTVINNKIQNGEAPHVVVVDNISDVISLVKHNVGAIAYMYDFNSILIDPSITVIRIDE